MGLWGCNPLITRVRECLFLFGKRKKLLISLPFIPLLIPLDVDITFVECILFKSTHTYTLCVYVCIYTYTRSMHTHAYKGTPRSVPSAWEGFYPFGSLYFISREAGAV